MKTLKLSVLTGLLMFTPLFASANIDASFSAPGPYITNTDSQFDVELTNFQILENTFSTLTIAGANIKDLKNAKFLDQNGWVKLTPYQIGADVIANFTPDTGFDKANKRVVTLQVNFKTAKDYVLGYSLVSEDGKVLSSTATPVTVTQNPVLGESVTRTLKYGDRGADVRALQEKMTKMGVYKGPITGNFLTMTRAAVKNLQGMYGLAKTGTVGPETQELFDQ